MNADARARLVAIEAGYNRFSRQVKRILALLAVAQLGLGILSVYLVGQNNSRAKETRALVDRIQLERARNVRDACVSQNAKNRDTKAELRRLNPDAPPKQQEATDLVIDKLAPVQDCEARVRSQVKVP